MSMIFTEEKLKLVKEQIEKAKNIAIIGHKSPDGDAVGSCLALQMILEKQGKNAVSIVPDRFPDFLKWMTKSETVLQYDTQNTKVETILEDAEMVFMLDFNATHRVGKLKDSLESAKGFKVMIDHHQQPEDCCKVIFSDTKSCSTAQMIYEFIDALGLISELDVDIAASIYTGIMTDTGSFRFAATTAKTHRIAADLMDLGLEHHLVHQYVYDTNSINRLRLMGYSLSEKLKIYPEKGAALISLSEAELKQFNYKKGDTEGLVNYALSIAGVKMAVFMAQKDGVVKISFRSKGGFSVNQVAREHFNGGGHINAAGGMLEMSLEDAINKFETLLPNLVIE